MHIQLSRTQRVVALLPLLMLLLALGQTAIGPGFAPSTTAWAQQAPNPPADVDVTITTEKEVWYLQPIWLGIGAAALILIIALLISGSRNTTTVIK